MSLFRADSANPFSGPHQGIAAEQRGVPLEKAKAVLLLVHGRGATAAGLLPLADEFGLSDVCYLAPQASGYTWYPYSFLSPTQQNEPGLSSGLQRIDDLIGEVTEAGLSHQQIVLAGFSQGACLVSEYAARHPKRYGGIIAWSGGVIGDRVDLTLYSGSLDQTPVFLGCSDVDPHIPVERVDETEKVFQKLGASVTKRIYPGMGHTINQDELESAREILLRLTSLL